MPTAARPPMMVLVPQTPTTDAAVAHRPDVEDATVQPHAMTVTPSTSEGTIFTQTSMHSIRLTQYSDSAKQAAQGWGGETGTAELNDEAAGEAIAGAEVKAALKEDGDAAPVNADGRTLEEQEADNSISYADYLVQKAERLSLQAAATRKANEGTKEDKKWAQASELKKTEEEEFIAGSSGKKTRTRERKQKEVLDIDQRFVEQPSRDGARGGRGGRGDGPRRGGERGAFRGARGDGAGRGRGGPRGGAPRGGAARGGAPRTAPVALDDTKAFPSLGA